MKLILGYGYKLSNESIKKVISHYYSGLDGLNRTKSAVIKMFNNDKISGEISKNAKLKIFKVTVEIK